MKYSILRISIKSILILLAFILCLFSNSYCQQTIEGIVKNTITGEVLPYATIKIINSSKGTITNLDGEFILKFSRNQFEIIVSYLGYEYKRIKVNSESNYLTILLNPSISEIPEINVVTHVYKQPEIAKILAQLIRTNTKKNTCKNKAFLRVSSVINDSIPNEFIEGFYNVKSNSFGLKGLALKNGRFEITETKEKRPFLSLNLISLFIRKIDLSEKKMQNEFGILSPFQYRSKVTITNRFNLKLSNFSDSVNLIKYYSKNENFVNGNIYYNKYDYSIEKLDMLINYNNQYPIELIDTTSKIEKLSFNLTISYNNQTKSISELYGSINYDIKKQNKVQSDNVETEFILQLYDYGIEFLKPIYTVSSKLNDYEEMSIIPYNKYLWNNEMAIVRTNSEQKLLNEIVSKHENDNLSLTNNFDTKIWHFNNQLEWQRIDTIHYKPKVIYVEEAGTYINKTIYVIEKEINIASSLICDCYSTNDTTIFMVDAIFDYSDSFFLHKRNNSSRLALENVCNFTKEYANITKEKLQLLYPYNCPEKNDLQVYMRFREDELNQKKDSILNQFIFEENETIPSRNN